MTPPSEHRGSSAGSRGDRGQAYPVKKESELAGVFAAIERDLRTQYLVSYVSNSRRKGTFHPVEVKTTHGHVTTAAGFFY